MRFLWTDLIIVLVSVQIEMYSAHELVDRVLNDKLDIAHSAYIEKNPGLNYVQLTDVEVDLVAKDTSPLAKYSIQPGREECRISLKEVEGEPMIMLPPSTVLRKVEENYFKKIDFKPNTAFMVNTHYSLLAMVAQKDILSLFENKVMNYPKPVSLLKYLIGMNSQDEDLILDFFSGSATTAHAVMQVSCLLRR